MEAYTRHLGLYACWYTVVIFLYPYPILLYVGILKDTPDIYLYTRITFILIQLFIVRLVSAV